MNELDAYKRALEREKKARQQAERLLDEKTREAWDNLKATEQAYQELQDTKDKLVQSEKLASIGQLAAGVAHEINNPVGYVLSNIDTLKDYIDDLACYISTSRQHTNQLPEQVQQTLEKLADDIDLVYLQKDINDIFIDARQGLTQVRDIVAELKNFSRASDHQFAVVDVNQLLESTLKLVNNELKYTVEVETNLHPIPAINANSNELTQVFTNLLVNAGQACDQEGKIIVSSHATHNRVIVTIKDNGCGIKQENLTRIFEPFFTTKPVGVGTGLGLSVSYAIVEKHKGTISASSTPDVGTQFVLSFPVAPPED